MKKIRYIILLLLFLSTHEISKAECSKEDKDFLLTDHTVAETRKICARESAAVRANNPQVSEAAVAAQSAPVPALSPQSAVTTATDTSTAKQNAQVQWQEAKAAIRKATQTTVDAVQKAKKDFDSAKAEFDAATTAATLSAQAASAAPNDHAAAATAKSDAAKASAAEAKKDAAAQDSAQLQKTANAAVAAAGKTADAAAASNGQSLSQFFDTNWSVGIAWLHNNRNIISDATITNNIVRANTSQRTQPELLIARHFYLHHDQDTCLWKSIQACPGGFIAVGLSGSGQSSIIDMLGLGGILGFGGTDKVSEQKHHLGIGWGRRFGVKVLGDGFSANAAPPTGETQIRYKTTDTGTTFVFYTYRFDN